MQFLFVPFASSVISRSKTLTLLDHQKRPIPEAQLSIRAPEHTIELSLVSVAPQQLTFTYYSDTDINSHLVLHANASPIYSKQIGIKAGVGTLVVPISRDELIGRENDFQLALSGWPCFLWQRRLFLARLYSDRALSAETQNAVRQTTQSREELLAAKLVKKLETVTAESTNSLYDALLASLGKPHASLQLPYATKPDVSVILPVGIDKADLYQFVGALLLGHNDLTYQLIWPTSSPDSVDIANLTLVSLTDELAPASALQLALNSALAPVTIVCPHNIELDSHCLETLQQSLSQTDIGFVGSSLQDYHGYIIDTGIDGCRDSHVTELELASHCRHRYVRPIDYSLVAPSAYRTEQIAALGINPESQSISDVLIDWQTRLRDIQLLGMYQPNAIARGQELAQHWRYHQKEANTLARHLAKRHNTQTLTVEGRAVLGTILVIDAQTPTPDSDAGSYAAIQEIKLLQALGYHVVFIPLKMSFEPRYTERLQSMGIEVCYAPYYRSFLDAILDHLPTSSAVYITRHHVASQCLETIRTHAPDVPVLFNNADLHFLREIRSALSMPAESEDQKRIQQQLLNAALETKNSELDVMKQANAVLSYNDSEHAVITSHLLTQDKIFKCPWVLEAKEKQCQFQSSQGIAFLGGYKHWPNVEAVEFFLEHVFPALVEQAPDINVYLYGSHMPDTFQRFSHPNLHLIGFVENLDDVFLNHRLFIAPLLSGAGIKGKVLESAAYGTPSVLSPIAAESTGLSITSTL